MDTATLLFTGVLFLLSIPLAFVVFIIGGGALGGAIAGEAGVVPGGVIGWILAVIWWIFAIVQIGIRVVELLQIAFGG
jgi:hypothetical protein